MIEPNAPTAPAPVTEQDNWRPRFFAIWGGQAISLVGSALTQFVLMWWITDTTGSANALALAGVMALLPTALFSPLGGAVADRFSRRLVMIGADAITALCMLVLVLLFASGRVQLWHVYTLMFVRATMQSFQYPAAMATTPNLVPPAWIARAAGMNQSLQGVMTIAAAPLGALALAVLPIGSALLIDVFTALLGITPLFFYAIPQPRSLPEDGERRSIGQEILDGARYVRSNRGMTMLFFVTGLVVLTILPAFSLTPLLVTEHFGRGVNAVAVMEGLSGLGIILGGVLISVRAPADRRVYWVLISFAVSCATVAFTALTPPALFWLAVLWWFISGFTFSTGNAPMMAILQTVVPNELQGRVISLLNVVIGLAGPLGLAVAGPLGEALGVAAVFILGGFAAACFCVAGLFSRSLRKIETGA